MNSITVIGEAIGDAIVSSSPPGYLDLRVMPGGGPVNTAAALSRLGTPTKYLGRLARGTVGDLLRRHLEGSNVDISGSVAAVEPASLAIATISATGRAHYDFYVNGTADWAWTESELSTWDAADSVAIHAGSLALAMAPGSAHITDLLRRARSTTTVCIDPNVRPGLVPQAFYREMLPRWAGLADVMRMSDDDLAVAMPGVSIDEACRRLHPLGTRLIVITQGSKGVYASLGGAVLTLPAPSVTLVDTVGAGDTFTAGLLHVLRHRGALGGRLDQLSTSDLQSALELATAAAAVVCERPGADPPWLHELAVMNRIPAVDRSIGTAHSVVPDGSDQG